MAIQDTQKISGIEPYRSLIDTVEVFHLCVPFQEMASATRNMNPDFAPHVIIVRIRVEETEGLGYAWDLREGRARAIKAATEDLVKDLVGRDSRMIGEHWHRGFAQLRYMGQHHGIGLAGLSAIDMALWDVLGKGAGLPLHHIWGAKRLEFKAYVAGGTGKAPEELADEGDKVRDAGYTVMKVQVGHDDWREDVRRVAKLRERVGDAFEILVDAHMGWDRRTASLAAKGFLDFGVTWFEDPMPGDDLDGYNWLRRTTGIPVVHGENAYTRQGILDILRKDAADIIMLDSMHCGGPTEMLQAAAIASAHFVPVSSHAFHPIASHVLSACDQVSYIEYQDAIKIFEGEPEPVNGLITLTDKPGFGLSLPDETIDEFIVR